MFISIDFIYCTSIFEKREKMKLLFAYRYYIKDNQSIKIHINPSSEQTIHKLQLLFDEALNYELSFE